MPPESKVSSNWFNTTWSGFRRVKNACMRMEWIPDADLVARSKDPLPPEKDDLPLRKVPWRPLTGSLWGGSDFVEGARCFTQSDLETF